MLLIGRKCKICGRLFNPATWRSFACKGDCTKQEKIIRYREKRHLATKRWRAANRERFNKKAAERERRLRNADLSPRKCTICPVIFNPKSRDNVYCSRKCRKNAERERRVEFTCLPDKPIALAPVAAPVAVTSLPPDWLDMVAARIIANPLKLRPGERKLWKLIAGKRYGNSKEVFKMPK